MPKSLAILTLIAIGAVALLAVSWIAAGDEAAPAQAGARDVAGASAASLADPSAPASNAGAGLEVTCAWVSTKRLAIGSVAPEPAESRRCTGLVVDGDQRGVAGIGVEIGVLVQGLRTALVAVASDARGRFEAAVPVPADAIEEGACTIYARIVEPGYQKPTGRRRLAKPDDEASFVLPLAPGSTISGRVLDRSGGLAGNALLELRSHGPRGPQGRELACSTRAWTGEFDLHFTRDGSYDLQINAIGTGSTFIAGLDLRLARDPAPFDVVARDPDSIAGTLVDEDGAPLPRVDLEVFPAELLESGREALALWNATDAARVPAGERRGSCTTDSRGAFRCEGLAPGSYFIVRTHDLALPSTPARRSVHATGEEEIRLVRSLPPPDDNRATPVEHDPPERKSP